MIKVVTLVSKNKTAFYCFQFDLLLSLPEDKTVKRYGFRRVNSIDIIQANFIS